MYLGKVSYLEGGKAALGYKIPNPDLTIFGCADEVQLTRLEERAKNDSTAGKSKGQAELTHSLLSLA